jgi:hypothetical protein
MYKRKRTKRKLSKRHKTSKRRISKKKLGGGINDLVPSQKVTRSTNRTLVKPPLKKVLPRAVVIPPFVNSGEQEDNLELSMAFLMEMMGGSSYDLYVTEFLNSKITGTKIIVKDIGVQNTLNPTLTPGQPTIFYGKGGGTHFTCTVDGITLWESYRADIQKNRSNNFCQTFALMYMEHAFFPNSFVGQEYLKLQVGEDKYLDNVMVAIKVACYVLKKLEKEFELNEYVETALDKKKSAINPAIPTSERTPIKILKLLLAYCESVTKEQIENSTFIEEIV